MEKIKKLLLERNGVVFVEKILPNALVQPKHLIYAIQAQLANYGFLMTTNLMNQLLLVENDELVRIEKFLISTIKEMIGAHVKHVPLYRNFPNDVPINTCELWWKRLTAFVAQDWLKSIDPEKCHILSCGHIVHEEWFDGTNYAACPICEFRVDLNSPFFKESKAKEPLTESTKIKIIDLGVNFDAEVQRMFSSLIQRKIVLSPADIEILKTILEEYDKNKLIVTNVPVKENVAILCGAMKSFDLIKTATDMLRTIVYTNGGDISLVKDTKFGKINRTDRKAILSRLDSFNVDNLTEDLLRYKEQWKRLGEKLHPFEFKFKYKNVTTAFVVLRETKLDLSLSKATRISEQIQLKEVLKRGKKGKIGTAETKLIFKNWNSRFNFAIDNKEWDKIFLLLSERPGEFSRKLDFVLRTVPEKYHIDIYKIFQNGVEKMSTPILCTLLSYLPYRSNKNDLERIFMPKGMITKAQVIAEKRKNLKNIDLYITCIGNELIKRSKEGDGDKVGFIDLSLNQITVPFNERNLAKALIDVPRGSRIKLESSGVLRSFVHWVEPKNETTDLDSTFIFYDENWKGIGECSYCHREYNNAAFHSGDLRSAPAPLGATEYVDLHIDLLKKERIRYVAACVFSYTGVPFHELPVAFAGVMDRKDSKKGEIFEPKTVEQKFSLIGESVCVVPFVIDLEKMELFWTDIHLKERAGFQASWSHVKTLNGQLKSLVNYYSSGVRPNMFQIAAMRLTSNCKTVIVRQNEKIYQFDKHKQSDHEFYTSLIELSTLGKTDKGILVKDKIDDEIDNAYLYKDDGVNLKEGASVYTLYRNNTNGKLKYTQASDVISF